MAVYLAVLTNLKWRCVNMMENIFTPKTPFSADATQSQWRHRETHGKDAWQDLGSDSSWSAKASHKAAETNSSMRVIHPELPQAPPVQSPCGLQFRKGWRASRRERRKMTALTSVWTDHSGTSNKHWKIISGFIFRFWFWLLHQLTWCYLLPVKQGEDATKSEILVWISEE